MEDNQLASKKISEDIPKTEMEVFMHNAKDIVGSFMQSQTEQHKISVESNERIIMKKMNDAHKEASYTYLIVGIVAIIGLASGIIMFLRGKSEIGFPIISSTITGVFAFLGGTALSKKQSD